MAINHTCSLGIALGKTDSLVIAFFIWTFGNRTCSNGLFGNRTCSNGLLVNRTCSNGIFLGITLVQMDFFWESHFHNAFRVNFDAVGILLNFDSICLSFWVITKTRRLVWLICLPYYAHILVGVTVTVLHSLKENTQFCKLIFKTTARFFSIVEKTW